MTAEPPAVCDHFVIGPRLHLALLSRARTHDRRVPAVSPGGKSDGNQVPIVGRRPMRRARDVRHGHDDAFLARSAGRRDRGDDVDRCVPRVLLPRRRDADGRVPGVPRRRSRAVRQARRGRVSAGVAVRPSVVEPRERGRGVGAARHGSSRTAARSPTSSTAASPVRSTSPTRPASRSLRRGGRSTSTPAASKTSSGSRIPIRFRPSSSCRRPERSPRHRGPRSSTTSCASRALRDPDPVLIRSRIPRDADVATSLAVTAALHQTQTVQSGRHTI